MQKYMQNFAVDASDAAKLKTRVEEGSTVPATEEEEEENDAYIEKDGLKFANFQATDVVKMLEELPTSWTVVQISVNSAADPALSRFNLILCYICYIDCFARFQGNKKDSGVLGNPALVVVIYFQDLLPLNLCPRFGHKADVRQFQTALVPPAWAAVL